MNTKSILFAFVLFSFVSTFGQGVPDLFNEVNYIEVSHGRWNDYYAITLENKSDTSKKLRIIYADSAKNESVYTKCFFSGDTMDGPCLTYSNNILIVKGYMKNNLKDGEELIFAKNMVLSERSTFKDGKRVGAWETYNSSGQLSTKVFFNRSGKFIKREVFDRKGNLIRTELEDKAN